MMNPLLMSSVRNSNIQSVPPDDGAINPVLDSNGFPLHIIHEIKVVVETFRVLIRAQWEYKIDVTQRVHWEAPGAIAPSNSSNKNDLLRNEIESNDPNLNS